MAGVRPSDIQLVELHDAFIAQFMITSAAEQTLRDALVAMRSMAEKVAKSARAQKDLAGRNHDVGFRTGGGDFTLHVGLSQIRFESGLPAKPDFTLVAPDPQVFARWVADGSLTDAAVEGSLWLPNKEAFELLPILDRLPRSVRRDAK